MQVYRIWCCTPAGSGRGVGQAAGQRPQSYDPGSSGRGCGHPWHSKPDSGCLHQACCSLHGRWSTPGRSQWSTVVGWFVCTTELSEGEAGIWVIMMIHYYHFLTTQTICQPLQPLFHKFNVTHLPAMGCILPRFVSLRQDQQRQSCFSFDVAALYCLMVMELNIGCLVNDWTSSDWMRSKQSSEH